MYGKIQKNCKKLFLVVGVMFVCALLSVGSSSCGTRPVVVATDESLVSSQVGNAKIESSNARLGELLRIYDEFFRETTRQYDEFIRDASERAKRGNLDAETALDGYDEFVQSLIYRIRELESRIRELESQILSPVQNSDDGLGTFPDQHGGKSSDVYSMGKTDTSTPVARYTNMTELARETAKRVE
jgi:hypothetical protein